MSVSWLQAAAPVRRASAYQYALAVPLALIGGVFGIAGAFYSGVQTGIIPLAAIIVGAPIIEEVLKPSGVYLALGRWPAIGRSRWFVALLAGLGGIAFGLIESLIYVKVYAPDLGQAFFVYRFTVTVLLHGGASMIAGLGINSALLGWANGENRLPRRSLVAFTAAMVIHGAYNTTVLVLALAGILTFD